MLDAQITNAFVETTAMCVG